MLLVFRLLGSPHRRLLPIIILSEGRSVAFEILELLRRTPIAVDPSLMASREYSTWKRRPSGENVLKRVN